MRVLMYSHDSYGLGHFRRTATLAGALVDAHPDASVLIVTGSPCATHFALPERVDVVKLPGIGKDADGDYVPRSLPGALDDVLDLRRRLLFEAWRCQRPDLLVVDHQVTGLCDEMVEVLEEARRTDTATLLGLRDVIDGPDVVAREWGREPARRALRRVYDRLCVYGWPALLDHRREYALPADVAARVEFTGLVVRPPPRRRLRPLPAERPSLLVTTGGGEDGSERLDTYLDCLDCLDCKAPFWDSQLLLGPLLPREQARRIRRHGRLLDGVSVKEFRADVPRLLEEADAVVAMAGYNTTAEILQSGLPAVLLPRSAPRREQLIRAQRLADLGLVECLPEPTPESLRSAVERALARRRTVRTSVPLGGAARFAEIALDLLGVRAAPPAQVLSA